MPFNVTLPNGVELKGVPDGTTKEQVMQKAISRGLATQEDFGISAPAVAPASGASPRMRRGAQQRSENIAEVEQYLSTLPAEDRARMESMGYGSRFGRGLWEGIETLARGAGGLVGMDTQRSPEEVAELEMIQRSSPDAAYKVGEFVGQSLPSMALGGATGAATRGLGMLGQGAAQAGVGAVEGAAMAKGEGGNPLTGAALGAIGAGVGQYAIPAARGIGRGVRRAGRAISGGRVGGSGNPLVDRSTGAVSPELKTALEAEGLAETDLSQNTMQELSRLTDGQLPPEYAARYALFESQGITPTRAQVTRDIDDAIREADLSRTSSNLAGRLDDQTQVMQDAFKQRIADTGNATNPEAYVHDVVTVRDDMLRQATNQAYEDAFEDAAQQGVEVSPSSLLGRIDSYKDASKDRWTVAKNVRQELRRLGVIDKDGNQIKAIQGEDAENIRQTINEERLSDATPEGRKLNRVVDDLRRSFDDDLDRDMDTESFKTARANAKKHADAMKAYQRTTGREKKKSLVRDILDDKVNADDLVDKVVFSKSYDDTHLDSLRDFMKDQGEAGKEAFDSLRAETLQSLFDKSAIGSETAAGARKLSAFKFRNQLNKIGDRKLKALFTPEEVKFLKNNAKALDRMVPPPRTGQGLGGVSAGLSMLERIGGKVPLVGDIAVATGKAIRQSASDRMALSSALRDIAGGAEMITPTGPIKKGVTAGVGVTVSQGEEG